MSTVSLMTSLLTKDCSRFLPPQYRTLGRRLFEYVSVTQQDPLMMQNAVIVSNNDDILDGEKLLRCFRKYSFLVCSFHNMCSLQSSDTDMRCCKIKYVHADVDSEAHVSATISAIRVWRKEMID